MALNENPAAVAARRQQDIQERFKELIAAFLPSVICDIGALNGADAIEFRGCSASSRIFAFEANLANYAAAQEASDFEAAGVHWIFTAIGNRRGIATFNVLETNKEGYDWRGGASSLLVHQGEKSTPQHVPMRTLDDMLDEHGLADNGKALWIDVEGAASLVLAGAQRSLRSTLFLKVEVETVEHWKGQVLAKETLAPLIQQGFAPIMTSLTEGVSQHDVLLISPKLARLGVR